MSYNRLVRDLKREVREYPDKAHVTKKATLEPKTYDIDILRSGSDFKVKYKETDDAVQEETYVCSCGESFEDKTEAAKHVKENIMNRILKDFKRFELESEESALSLKELSRRSPAAKYSAYQNILKGVVDNDDIDIHKIDDEYPTQYYMSDNVDINFTSRTEIDEYLTEI